jgi:hypothetical protein
MNTYYLDPILSYHFKYYQMIGSDLIIQSRANYNRFKVAHATKFKLQTMNYMYSNSRNIKYLLHPIII